MAKAIRIGSILCGLAVVTGAFGAHGLEEILLKYDRVDTWETAVLYHFIHGLAIIITGFAGYRFQSKYIGYAQWSFFSGIALFSGSLYVLSLTNMTWLGMITPIGGVMFIVGWLFLALGSKE